MSSDGPPKRYSSPFGPPPNNRSESARLNGDNPMKKKTMLDLWMEPGLAPSKPPFAEAGLERHGVVANMAALGTPPSAKVMKTVTKADMIDPALLALGGMVKKSGASSVAETPSQAFTTPEPSTNPQRRHSLPDPAPVATESVQQLETTPAQAPLAPIMAPTPPPPTPRTPSLQTTPRPPSQGQAYGQSVFALQKPVPLNTPRPVPQPVALPAILQTNKDVNLARTDAVVEMAVQMAVDARRWPTAYALRTLYDDHRLNPRMVLLIDAIYDSRADIDQEKEFKQVMTHKKREGKKDRTGEYYFNGDGTDPLPPQFSQFPENNPVNEGRSVSAGRSMSDGPQSFMMSASPYNDHTDPSSHHVSKKHRGNDFQPPSDLDMDGNVNGKPQPQQNGEGTPNSTEREKSRSMSSSSALSSLDDAFIGSGNFSNTTSPLHKTKDSLHGGGGGGVAGSPRFAAHANANTTSAAETHPSGRNQSGPITTTHKPGPKTFTFSTAKPSSSTNNNSAHAKSSHQQRPSSSTKSTKPSMAPAALLAPSRTSSPSLPPSAVFKTKKIPTKDIPRPSEDNDRSHLKRDAERKRVRENPHPVQESFERHKVKVRGAESASDGGDSIAHGPSKRINLKLNNGKKTRQSQAANYDSDTLSSPTALSFRADIAPGSLSASRAGTPNNFNRPTRKSKTGTGLRVKTSPMKKKGGGTLAGIPRASGERNSPTNGAFPNNQDDNDDYCSSCGGNGDLVCCDGCTRSFHMKCVDPPMVEGSLPDEWFCNKCLSANAPRVDTAGIFGSLLAALTRKNPVAFHLPKDIREYFENVKTGPEGEYEEGPPPKTRQRAGWDEQPDYFRLKDNKGKTILCHRCQGAASAPDRAIIPCTFCGLNWHLDCVDVPMAKEPAPGKPWRCPAHVDDLLSSIPGLLAPAHRFRKIKGASVIKPAISRGVRNNGHIEIENAPTDDEEELGFYEQREYGHIYKLPELGIKLDFISQVRRTTGGAYALPPPRRAPKSTPRNGTWNQRTIAEKQAALNLASLTSASEVGDAGLLINALLAEAPPNVVALIAKGDAEKIAKNKVEGMEKKSLIALRALIDGKLGALDPMDVDAPEPAAAEGPPFASASVPTSPPATQETEAETKAASPAVSVVPEVFPEVPAVVSEISTTPEIPQNPTVPDVPQVVAEPFIPAETEMMAEVESVKPAEPEVGGDNPAETATEPVIRDDADVEMTG